MMKMFVIINIEMLIILFLLLRVRLCIELMSILYELE